MSYLELLPAVDVKDGRAVRLVQGELDAETSYGSPLDAALDFPIIRCGVDPPS